MSLELDDLLTIILILKLVGLACIVAAFVQFVRRGHVERIATALRNFIDDYNQRS